MDGAEDKLCELCYQAFMFAVAFRHEKCQGAPVRGLVAGNNNSRLNVLGDFGVCRLLKLQRNGSGCRNTVGDTILLEKYFHLVSTHGFIV